tara:strand:+ start:455 stop:646 length:192 start_codon:yes stop_codon:yes gene_type:complete
MRKVMQTFESPDGVISYTLEEDEQGEMYICKKGDEPELLTGTRADKWERWAGLQMFLARSYCP